MRLLRRAHAVRPPSAPPPDELEAFLVAAHAAAGTADPARALDVILDAAIRLVRADEGSIQLLDRATSTLSVVASRGLSQRAKSQVVPLGRGVSGTVAASGDPLLLTSSADVERFEGHIQKERAIASAICAPMRAGGAVVGVLNVNRTQGRRTFGSRDLRLVTLFAETSAITIEKSRLLEETRRRTAEVEGLRLAAMRLSESLDLDAVADAALAEALALAGSSAGFLCVVDPASGQVEMARFRGLPREGLRVALAPSRARELVPATARVVHDTRADEAFAPLAAALGDRWLLLLPLQTAEGRPDGLLGLAVAPGAGIEAERVLQTYAAHAGLALANALLHHQISDKERELATVVAGVGLPMVLVGPDGRFRAINPAAAVAFRVSVQFEKGRPARGKLPAEIEALLFGGAEDSIHEVEIAGPAGPRVWRAAVTTVRAGPGFGSRLLVLTDLTAARELESKKRDFLAVVGHELRTPLTNIKGYADTLGRHVDSMSRDLRAKAIRTIQEQGERLEGLIEDLLAMSRIESHGLPLRLGREDVAAICLSAIEEARRRRPERAVDFTGPGEPVLAVTDRIKLEKILGHLIDNALKYSADDRPVEVTLANEGRDLSIAVRDRGEGIFSGDLPKLFQPFGQLDPSSTRRYGGTGVGLFIAKTLAEGLGGRIRVTTALGKGSTFTLIVPRESKPAQTKPQP